VTSDGDALAASALGLVAGAWLPMGAGLAVDTAAAGGVVAEDEQATRAAATTSATKATLLRRARR
jgi:hypothetical protein